MDTAAYSYITCVLSLDGDPAFGIRFNQDTSITQLKEDIYQKRPKKLSSVDPDELKLYLIQSHPGAVEEVEGTSTVPENHTLMKAPLKKLSEYIKAQDCKTLYVFVDFQHSQPTAKHQDITEAFPQGLKYKPPIPLLKTSGFEWEYQSTQELQNVLREFIKPHYSNFKAGWKDKSTMPLYLFLSGAGTGKSRNGTEFHQQAIACLGSEDEELRDRLRNAWVFLVSLENGASLLPTESDPWTAIGSRMLHQLLPHMSFGNVTSDYIAFPPSVLDLVAKGMGKKLEDATFIVVVDGMQNLLKSEKDTMDASSQFYRTMNCIGDLAQHSAFVLPCCTATSIRPAVAALKPSSRLRAYLPITPLKPPTIRGQHVFPNNLLIRLLVDDCGGHGRALEILADLIQNNTLEACNVDVLLHTLRARLGSLYATAFDSVKNVLQHILRAIFVHQRLIDSCYIPGTRLYPQDVVAPGLIRYENGYLYAPYIWLWVLCDRSGRDETLLGLGLGDHGDLQARGDLSMLTSCTWENFERFIARFRALKSRVIEEAKETSIHEIHAGARLNGNIKFNNHHLEVCCAARREQTRTTTENSAAWNIICAKHAINVRNHCNIVINARSAPAGDAFLSLDTRLPATEVHQYKFYQGKRAINNEDYLTERAKAASNNDFFILFTTQKIPKDFTLPMNSGIVDSVNWKDYFGPMAGRAFIFATEDPPNINEADYATLQLVEGVGSATAATIIKKRPFTSMEDVEAKTGLKRGLLENFKI